MAGTDDVDHVQIALTDEAVPVNIEKIQAGRGSPMAEQPRLDVVEGEGALEQGIVFEVDLAHGKVVCGAPVGVHFGECFRAQGGFAGGFVRGYVAHECTSQGGLRDTPA